MVSKNPRREVRGRLDAKFVGEIFELAETQTSLMTDKLNGAFKKSKVC